MSFWTNPRKAVTSTIRRWGIGKAKSRSPSSPSGPRKTSGLTGSNLTPEELTREGYKVLTKDRARLSNTPYTPYKGKTVSPMSTLTQRARELGEESRRNPQPRAGAIQQVLNRPNEGITPHNVQNILGRTDRKQTAFGQGALSNILRNEFQSSFAPRERAFHGQLAGDVNRYLPQMQGNLDNIALASGHLEGARNRGAGTVLQGLQRNEQGRRDSLIKNLDEFGNQQHAYNNMRIAADRARFNQEVEAPRTRMRNLEMSLSPHAASAAAGAVPHPDLNRTQGANVIQALRAYGIDPSKPVSEWDANRIGRPEYKGQLVADLPSDITASQNVLERLNPNLRGPHTDRLNQLTAGFTNNPNISQGVVAGLDQNLAGQEPLLETAATKKAKKDLLQLNNKFIKLGQYNSPQHLKAVEDRMQEINQASLEQRDKTTQNTLNEQLKLQHEGELGNIQQAGQLGAQTQTDYSDLLKSIRDQNQLGATKFANEQGENEALYKNFSNEAAWEWPHMRSIARQGARNEAIDDMFRTLEGQGINLADLGSLNTRYSETERQNRQLQADLDTQQQARDELERQRVVQQQAQQQRQLQQQQMRYEAASAAEHARTNTPDYLRRKAELEARWAAHRRAPDWNNPAWRANEARYRSESTSL